jgi:hypothetical protein
VGFLGVEGSPDAQKQGGQCSLVTLYPEDYAVNGHIFSPRLHPGMTVAETRLFTVVGVVGSRRQHCCFERSLRERKGDSATRCFLFLWTLGSVAGQLVFLRDVFLRARRCAWIQQRCVGRWLGVEGLCQSYPFVSLQKVTAPPAKLYLRRTPAAQLSQEKVSFGVLKCSERGTAGGVT